MPIPPALVTDPYESTAEFVEHGLGPAWAELGPVLTPLLAAAPVGGALVDVGAGGGRAVLLAGTATAGPIHAVEPSAALRTVLQARLALDTGLRDRTTVHAQRVEEAPLPPRWSALLALHVLGHLDADARARLWALAAQRLLPGAPVVATVQPPDEVMTVPEADWGSFRIGEHTVTCRGRADPTGPDTVTWTIDYRVLSAEGEEIRAAWAAHEWHVLGMDRLLGELRAAGLDARPVTDSVARATVGGERGR